MTVQISGVLKDGASQPVQDCVIQLKAKKTSPTVVVEVISSTVTDMNGHYSIEAEPGYYSVSLMREGFPPSVAGDIYVAPTDAPDTLNAFLDAPRDGDLRPEVMKRFEVMVNTVIRLSEQVTQDKEVTGAASDAAKKSADAALESERESRRYKEQSERHAVSARQDKESVETLAGEVQQNADAVADGVQKVERLASEVADNAGQVQQGVQSLDEVVKLAQQAAKKSAASAGESKTSADNSAQHEQDAQRHAQSTEHDAQQTALDAQATAEHVRKSAEVLEEIRKLAPENYGKRFENFDDIVRRSTAAMLRLERPEIESTSVRLTVAENINYDYTGDIHGQCDIAEPEQYRVEMYAYTTGEYFNGEVSIEHDGTFYFKRSWAGAKQFRLIRKKDNSWITTLEFPLCIRSYWMADEKDPDVVRVMKDRCYTYDQAVAALALMVQRHEATDRYVAGLCALVEPEGGVKFYVNRLSGQSPRAYYRMGNAAWVYYALAFYLEKFPDGVHASLVREKLTQGMVWLETFKVSIPGDLREGLYMGGRGKFQNGGTSFDPDYIAEWCALEHNVDIWFLFELMGRTGFDGYTAKADALAEKIISGFWMESEGRFRQGVHPGKYDDAAALDQSSWGGVFIANIDMEKAQRCHKYMSRFYYGTKETRGYTPYHPDYGYSGHSRGVWVEGTAGVALFERKMGNDQRAMDLIAALAPLCNAYGYRDSCADPSYNVLPMWPSTTNTAWVILVCMPDNFWLVNSPVMDVGLIEY